MKWNRKKIIPLLLGVYALLGAAACYALPGRMSVPEEAPVSASVSAPLALPDELKEKLAEDDGADDAPENGYEQPEADMEKSEEPEETDDNAKKTDNDGKRRARITTRNDGAAVNVRARPSFDARVTATLHGSDTVRLLSADGDWYEIKKGAVRGFVYKDSIGE